MSNNDEYILDIKVEDTVTLVNPNDLFSSEYDMEDVNSSCSTITASEGGSRLSEPETGLRQKKLRVLIKKLPQKVLDQYFGKNDPNSSMLHPRVSTRLRKVPSKYRSSKIYIPPSFKQVIDISKNTNKNLRQTKSYNQEKCLGISKDSLTISKTNIPSYRNTSNKTVKQATPTVSNEIDAVTVDSSNILVIRQPVLKNDPLNILRNRTSSVSRELNQIANKGIEKETELDTDQITATEENNEPEVIKRIYYASKSSQTKFTCNGSICGLVDSDEFNLNCFYCYQIFPLHKWLEFKQHIKIQHHVEEKQNQTQEPIDEFTISEPTLNKSSLASQQTNRIIVKSTDDLNKRTSEPETYYISDQDKLSLYKPVQKNQFKLKKVVKFIEVAKKIPPKTPLSNIQLNYSKEKSSPQKQANNSPINQSKNLATNSQLQQVEEFIDLSSDNEAPKSPYEDLNSSYVDEIISICDDNEGEEELQLPNDETNKKLPNTNISFPKPGNTTVAPLPKLPAHIKNITIKRLDKSASNKTDSTSFRSSDSLQSQTIMKKAYIKLPSNLSIKEVLKTIPKPISIQNSSITGSTKPRYFVVKRVTKLGGNQKESSINLPKDTVNTTTSSTSPKQHSNDDDDDMPSNDENEDEFPKPTNGCGILFGLTNREVVIEFLLKLKTFPELWRPHLNDATIDYDNSIQQLCSHLNEKFDLNIQDFEMRLSIQRVKDWYCHMLKNIYNHKQDPSNTEPYKHAFPEYFTILNKFLTSDVHYAKNLLLSTRFKATNTSMSDYPKWMVYKPGQVVHKVGKIHFDEQTKPESKSKPKPPKKRPIIRFKPTNLPEDDSTQNIIEFDADTLYAVDSSDESLILPPDPKPKKFVRPKGTRIYNPVVPFVCEICERHFKRNIDLRRHRVMHFPPRFKCSACSRMFFHKHYAENCRHIKKKTMNSSSEDHNTVTIKSSVPKLSSTFRQWMCEICGMSYRSVGSLNSHKNEKHLNRRLKCVVCKFTAVTNYRIVQHQKKRHVVEPGTVEEIAKKCRARLDSKTPFTTEARQEFDWRREMRKKLKPGELFHGCCKCRIIFYTRKEKLLHNKLEHPIKDTTVICLLCQPEKLLLSNSNSVRRHYTDMHKVPWDEIDDLVKRTKPIFKLLTQDEIEELKSSENYTEVLNEIMTRRNIKLDLEPVKEESIKENEHLPNEINQQLTTEQGKHLPNEVNQQITTEQGEKDECHATKTNINNQEENSYVDVITDHDYNTDYGNDDNDQENVNQDNVTDSQHIVYNDDGTLTLYQNIVQEEIHVDDDGYAFQYAGELVDGELVEESIVEEEFIEDEDFIEEDAKEDFFK